MKKINIILVGNPNTGKTSLFNELTGLNQKTGNYAGVTIDKKQGTFNADEFTKVNVIDLPGAYSIHPNSSDEKIVLKTLLEPEKSIDIVIVVAEVENLKRNLFLFSQIKDLGLPALLVINMVDQIKRKGIEIDAEKLCEYLQSPVILVSVTKKQGLADLKSAILNYKTLTTNALTHFFDKINTSYFTCLQNFYPEVSTHLSWLRVTERKILGYDNIPLELTKDAEKIKRFQQKETIYRYQYINLILKDCYHVDRRKARNIGAKLDRFFIHPVLGYLFFMGILLLMFQAIFAWAVIPMDFIDESFTFFADWVSKKIPEGTLNGLITQGIIAGIGGIVIFVPQIAILFLFIELLEQSGYMSRAVFLMDRIMKIFGMNGKSIIALISGNACAIPAIMSTRNIGDWKVRLITILVTPFTTCSARLPVYAILIALVIPNETYAGFNLQGIVLMGLYLFGVFTAIISAAILNKVLKIKRKSFFMIEMPDYKIPIFKNLLFQMIEKSKAFVWGAGKIILAISIVLWFLSTHGGEEFKNAENTVKAQFNNQTISQKKLDIVINSYKLENSYIGKIGKFIEPAIKPLGYDWKIGIALLTSFAAREVFVGTLATIYSVDSQEQSTIKQRMAMQINPVTKEPVFNFATGMGLMIFYAFAMQCMGTLAIVKKETKSWKWPIIQLVGMGIMAYIGALITYSFLK